MASPVNDSYTRSGGRLAIYAGRTGPAVQPPAGWAPYVAASAPAWRQPMAPFEWKELTSARYRDVGSVRALDAWCGLSALGTRVITAGIGGHEDGYPTQAFICELNTAAPIFVVRGVQTADADVLWNSEYNADGRPSGSHTYYSLQANAARNKLFRFGGGSVWGDGMTPTNWVDAWDATVEDWDPPRSHGAWSAGQGACCTDYTTGDVYMEAGRWSNASATVTKVFPPQPWFEVSGYYAASYYDSLRQRFVMLSNFYRSPDQLTYRSLDPSVDQWFAQTVTMNTATVTAAELLFKAQDFAYYHPIRDKVYIRRHTGSVMLQMDPETFVVSDLPTTGTQPPDGAPNIGVLGKMVPIPALGGAAYLPRGSASLYFLATE